MRLAQPGLTPLKAAEKLIRRLVADGRVPPPMPHVRLRQPGIGSRWRLRPLLGTYATTLRTGLGRGSFELEVTWYRKRPRPPHDVKSLSVHFPATHKGARDFARALEKELNP